MSASLHDYVHSRFAEVFGPPNMTMGKDIHWALRPNAPNPIPINVLVNGSDTQAILWVFDPYDTTGQTIRLALSSEAEVDRMILQIQDRVKKAGRPA